MELLSNSLEQNPEDVETATKLAHRLGALRCQELVRLVRSMSEVRSALSPQQREVLENSKF